MPRIRTSRTKRPPEGFEEIEPTLLEFQERMRQVENTTGKGSKSESLAPIFQLHHQRSRYVYDLYYKREAISSELYNWLLKQNYADANLIAKWKKPGYEKLCCLRCIQTAESKFGSTCICRVPKAKLGKDAPSTCVHCGCRGCASGD
ncbi:G10 protein [Schizosaccharomyces octosporus yFS286]|uniref:G10 protein n=1 Tax=Schizosaccharomyces octosporus (strain yFS286) TaxID=483514 RepID=S9PX27_SCHOY|nr:G10 protein [Schizosaccharomyces octosporus yFS286]EPX72542.1 G10 protein [Schizosaccharomyces octosporus yFS286]